jgi:DNA polymerase-3 subunit delta
VQQRATAAKLKLTPAAAQALAERVEGNLLAADQEIKRLALSAAGEAVEEAEVLESVANNSRFDVFTLADAVLAGETARAFKILWSLRAEGVAPVLISWALNRDIGLLAQLDYAVRHGDHLDGALEQQRVWRRRQALVKQAMRRFKTRQLAALLTQAAQVDATLKGVFPAEPWATLTGLLIAMLSQPEKA